MEKVNQSRKESSICASLTNCIRTDAGVAGSTADVSLEAPGRPVELHQNVINSLFPFGRGPASAVIVKALVNRPFFLSRSLSLYIYIYTYKLSFFLSLSLPIQCATTYPNHVKDTFLPRRFSTYDQMSFYVNGT